MKRIALTLMWCVLAWMVGASLIGVLFVKMGVIDELTLGIIGFTAGAFFASIALVQGFRGKLPGTTTAP